MSWLELILFEETPTFGTIFSKAASVSGCILWTCFWASLHKVLPAHPPKSICLDPVTASARRFYIRKLRRMLIYCASASLAGMTFFLHSSLQAMPTKAMLTSFGPLHQICFWMAVGHWLVALWEDWHTCPFLGQGLKADSGGGLALFPLNLCCSPFGVMYATYTAHHIVTLMAYGYALWTSELGGVMVQGLLFELPVVFMLRRELGIASEELPEWLKLPSRANAHWWMTYAAFLAGRGPAECLWVVSMIPFPYGSELLEQSLSQESLIVYHLLAIFFSSLNIRIVGLLCCWHAQDVTRAKSVQQEQLGRQIAPEGTPASKISKE